MCIPDGYEQIILDNPIRTRYRRGRDPDDVMLMTPGKPEELHIDLWNTAFTFEKGHKIQVTVTSSNATKFRGQPEYRRALWRADRDAAAGRDQYHLLRQAPSFGDDSAGAGRSTQVGLA